MYIIIILSLVFKQLNTHTIHIPQGLPPSYFKTNEFTGTYQGIVNTYGVPMYKEVSN